MKVALVPRAPFAEMPVMSVSPTRTETRHGRVRIRWIWLPAQSPRRRVDSQHVRALTVVDFDDADHERVVRERRVVRA